MLKCWTGLNSVGAPTSMVATTHPTPTPHDLLPIVQQVLCSMQKVIDSLHLAQQTVNQHNWKMDNLLSVIAKMSTQLNGLLFGLWAVDLRFTTWHSSPCTQTCPHSYNLACKHSRFILGHPTSQSCSYQHSL